MDFSFTLVSELTLLKCCHRLKSVKPQFCIFNLTYSWFWPTATSPTSPPLKRGRSSVLRCASWQLFAFCVPLSKDCHSNIKCYLHLCLCEISWRGKISAWHDIKSLSIFVNPPLWYDMKTMGRLSLFSCVEVQISCCDSHWPLNTALQSRSLGAWFCLNWVAVDLPLSRGSKWRKEKQVLRGHMWLTYLCSSLQHLNYKHTEY